MVFSLETFEILFCEMSGYACENADLSFKGRFKLKFLKEMNRSQLHFHTSQSHADTSAGASTKRHAVITVKKSCGFLRKSETDTNLDL